MLDSRERRLSDGELVAQMRETGKVFGYYYARRRVRGFKDPVRREKESEALNMVAFRAIRRRSIPVQTRCVIASFAGMKAGIEVASR